MTDETEHIKLSDDYSVTVSYVTAGSAYRHEVAVLEQLRSLSHALKETVAARDKAIFNARTDGISLRKIAKATGLSHQTINNIWLAYPQKRLSGEYPQD